MNTYLDGIYVSNSGSIAGPWTKIADSHKLATSGSALKQTVGGKGYGPGIQAWYNQFLIVDPANPKHVYAGPRGGLRDQGRRRHLDDTGTVLELLLRLLGHQRRRRTRCPQTTHPDQHAVAIGTVGKGRRSSSATTAASTAGRSTARSTPTGTPPTGES